jgi:hypothetical protein
MTPFTKANRQSGKITLFEKAGNTLGAPPRFLQVHPTVKIFQR